jgi:alpha-beta hydrolase superfamily lysophospholipase
MPWYYRVVLWLGDHFAAGLKPSGRGLGRQASDNIDMLRDNARDPLFIKNTRIDSVFGLVNLMDAAMQASGRQKLPILYLTGRNDQIIPPKAAAEAMDRLLDTDPKARGAYYDQAWHMMLRDHDGATVLGDIAAFMTDQSAPLPSGADKDALAHLMARAKKPWVEK